jgi:Zinc finger, C3HC4 type (RING finger)
MDKYSLLDWAPEGGFLHNFTSTLLYSSSDEGACAAVGMSRPEPDVRAPLGSFSLLWPTYLRLCISHLVETISCHLQQTPVMTEVGMSIFEHSLAFAEAETMISQALGLSVFGMPKARSSNHSTSTGTTIPASGTILAISDATTSLTGPHLLDRVNVPIEVLLVALLSCCNALTSNMVSVFNKQRSLRLINTGFWGLCFIAAFVWGFCNTSTMMRLNEDGESEVMRTVNGLLHFPTVAIIGFLPHMTILLGILVCATIYAVALTLTVVSLGSNPNIPRPTSFLNRFRIAHDNLQAAIQVRGINIKWQEDFYTALLRIGFTALTAASEAVFLNEGRSVEMRQFTWLEEERLDEIEASRSRFGQIETSHFQIAEEYGLPPSSPGASDRGGKWESGYAKERKLEKEKESDKDNSDSIIYPNPRSGGVGVLQRTTRFYLLLIYLRGILYLGGGYLVFGFGAILDRIGITTRPTWLRNKIGRSLKQAQLERNGIGGNSEREKGMGIWFLAEDGSTAVPRSLDIDIEPEMRRRLALRHSGNELEDVLDQKMYEWWSGNGWYGTKDGSGDYEPSQREELEDTTSVISMSTNASTADNAASYTTTDEREWESESDGRRTPTRRSPEPFLDSFRSSRSTSPTYDTVLDVANLARLLNPQDRASREEARMLASHLAASASGNRIMTRSRYRHELETERSRVLLAGRRPLGSKGSRPAIPLYPLPNPSPANQLRPLTPTEEVEVLESLILSRRHPQQAGQPDSSADNQSAAEATGPTMPCVVCQAAPRTIIAWPCRCLCVCEDCRVNLALNNFGNCVTCRRGVGGFVRLWVP